MKPATLRRLAIGAVSFVAALVVALLALPSLIDINAYKPEIVAEVKRATGRALAVDGPISLQLLPWPTVRLDGVRFADIVEAKSVAVRPSLPALMSGRIEASAVSLVEPRIVLQVDANGQPNWTFAAPAGETRTLPANSIAIENGTLIFSDARTGLSVTASKMTLTASAAAMDGPLSMAGRATIDDSPVKIDLSLSAKGPAGHDADIVLQAAGGELSYRGTLSEVGPGARLSGRASASADNLAVFVETLARIAGQNRPHLPPLLAGKFRFSGPVELSRMEIVAKDFTLELGEDKGSGSLTVTLEPALAVDARFAVARFDLDRWLQTVALPADLMEGKLPDWSSPAGPTPAPTPPPRPSGLATLKARLAVKMGEVIYNKEAVRNVVVELEARGGAVAVPKFNATLPGDLVMQAASVISDKTAQPNVPPGVSGEFKLEGPKLRETLAWLKADLSAVPANKLTHVSLHGRMSSRSGNVQVDDAVFALDDLEGKGGITVAFTNPLSIVARLELGTVDLDSFIVPSGEGKLVRFPTDGAVPVLALVGPSLGLKLEVAKINYRGEVISGVTLDIARQAGTLRLNDLKVTNLAGARLEMRGAVANYWTTQPRANVAFGFDGGRGAVQASGAGTLTMRQEKEGEIRTIAYTGQLVVAGQPLDASIEADLAGRPNISADFKTDVLDLGHLARAGAGAAPARSIDTASWRRFDGRLRFTAGTLRGAPPNVGQADIAAELKDGKLTIAHFKAGLHGGSLELAGVVDATQPVLSFELKGGAKGLRVSDMMRSLSGTNEVGSLIKITLDGTLNADDIALRGTGSTVEALKASLAGGARVSGHVHPRADRFLQVIGMAATGVAGGVLDLTLGNLMSLFGHKEGVGAGNLLNAISLVLNRYVNRDNPLSGDVDIAGGILSDRHLRLQGSGATAAIATRTNLGNATTHTTISFTLTEDPSAPYLIVTAEGALAGPAFSAIRGSAKDPPGMTNILSTIEKAPSLLPHISIPKIDIPNPFSR